MGIKLSEIKNRKFLACLDDPLGAVGIAKREHSAPPALGSDAPAKQSRRASVVVSLIRVGKKSLDSHDNLRAGFKPLVDAIAKSIGIDDGDPGIRWQYGQVETAGEPGTIVRIEGRIGPDAHR